MCGGLIGNSFDIPFKIPKKLDMESVDFQLEDTLDNISTLVGIKIQEKGLAGNLAATDLQTAAVNLEKLVKGIDQKAPSLDQLNSKFSELENALNQIVQLAEDFDLDGIQNLADGLDVC